MGVALRIFIVAAWLALLGAHAARHLGARGAALAPDFAAHVGQHLSYAVLADRGAGGQRLVGTCTWSCERTADGLRIRTRTHASLSDGSVIPGFTRLAAVLGEDSTDPQPVVIDATEEHDAAGALTLVSAEATAFGASATGSAALARDGTHLRWSVPGVAAGERAYPAPHLGEAVAALPLGAMPSGLRPGQTFALALLGADAAALAPQARRAVFAVGNEVEEVTTLGQRLLLPLVPAQPGDDGPRLWCDSAGLVHRVRLDALGLTLELRTAVGVAP